MNIFGTTISLAAFPNLNIVDEKVKAKQRQGAERVRVSRAFSSVMGLGETKDKNPPPHEQSQFSPET